MFLRVGLGFLVVCSSVFSNPVLEATRLGDVARRVALEGLGREPAAIEAMANGASSAQSAALWSVFSRLGRERRLTNTTNWAELAQVALRDSFASQERLIAAVTGARREGPITFFGATFPSAEARETAPPVVTFPQRDPRVTDGLDKKLREARRNDALSVYAAVHFEDADGFRAFGDFTSRNSMVVGEVSARLGASSARIFHLTGVPRALEGLLRQSGLLWVGLRRPRLAELDLFEYEAAPAHGKIDATWLETLRASAPEKALRAVLRLSTGKSEARRRLELELSGAAVLDFYATGALIEGTREVILKTAALDFVRGSYPETRMARPAAPKTAPKPSEAGLLEEVRFGPADRGGGIVTLHVEVRSFGGTEPRHFTLRVDEDRVRVVRTVPDVLESISGTEAVARWMPILVQTREMKPGKYRLENPPGGEIEVR